MGRWPSVPSITPRENGLTFVRGRVAANGGIVAGSGFTVVSNGGGTYSITFPIPFSEPPTVVATSENATAYDSLMVTLLTVNGFQLKYIAQAVGTDGPFGFLAVGPN